MSRPCPYVACKYHLYIDVHPVRGSIKVNFPDLEVWELNTSCALDVADRGGVTLEEVGAIMNLTRQRVRQLEREGLTKLAAIHDLAQLEDVGVEQIAGDDHRQVPAKRDALEFEPSRAEAHDDDGGDDWSVLLWKTQEPSAARRSVIRTSGRPQRRVHEPAMGLDNWAAASSDSYDRGVDYADITDRVERLVDLMPRGEQQDARAVVEAAREMAARPRIGSSFEVRSDDVERRAAVDTARQRLEQGSTKALPAAHLAAAVLADMTEPAEYAAACARCDEALRQLGL